LSCAAQKFTFISTALSSVAPRRKTVLSVLRWKSATGGCGSIMSFGDEVDNERAVPAQRLLKLRAPALELGLALTQRPADDALKGLRQRGIREVA
jgi:hypothetical protein